MSPETDTGFQNLEAHEDLQNAIIPLRGHHAPQRGFQLINDLESPFRNRFIEAAVMSPDWNEFVDHVLPEFKSILMPGYKKERLEFLSNISTKREDGYVTDLVGSDIGNRDVVVGALVEAEIADIQEVFSRPSSQKVMVGHVLDRECGQCSVGDHCVRTVKGSEDSRLARVIKQSCDALSISCELEDSPNNIDEYDDQDKKIRAKVAVLALGDLRDFLLRRLLFVKEEYQRLTTISRTLFRELDKTNEEQVSQLVKIDTQRMSMLCPRLAYIDVSFQDELDLQSRINATRT